MCLTFGKFAFRYKFNISRGWHILACTKVLPKFTLVVKETKKMPIQKAKRVH